MINKSRAVFLFTGQGYQYHDLSANLYRSNATFRDTLQKMDVEASGITGYSVINSLYRMNGAARKPADDICYSHAVTYMLEYALAMALQEEMDVHPSYVLGVGLGEAVAATVCGAVDPSEMLSVVLKQAIVLQECCDEGGMIAITQDPLQEDARQHLFRIFDKSSLVTVYHCGHYILAAPANTLSKIKAYLGRNNISYHQLPVKYALHSPLIDAARSKFIQCSRKLHFCPPSIPFISGVYATQLYNLSPYYLWQSMRDQIRFSDAIRHLEATGKYCYIDCSPWGTLQPICNEIIHRESASYALDVITPSNQEQNNLELIRKRLDCTMPVLYRNSL